MDQQSAFGACGLAACTPPDQPQRHAAPEIILHVRLWPDNTVSAHVVSTPAIGRPAWSQDLVPPTFADAVLPLTLATPHSKRLEGVTDPAGAVSLHIGFL